MARPIEHISIVRVPDPKKTYQEWLALKKDPERERLLQEAREFGRSHPLKTDKYQD